MANALNGFLKEVWAKDIILSARENIDLKERVRVFTGSGTKIHVPVINGLIANDFVSQVTIQDATSTDAYIELNKHKEVSFVVHDIEQAQANADIRKAYTDEAGAAIAEAINKDIMALYASLSQSVGSAGTDITEDTILAAKLALDKAKAPKKDRTLVVAPEQENALLKIDRFTRADAIGGDAIKEGMLGRIHGFDVMSTADVPVVEGTPNTTHNLAFHRNAIGIGINAEPRVQAQYKVEYLGYLVVVDILYGVRVLKDAFAVDVLS